VDVCVIGGSCTGVFAALRAARLGLRVALVEKRTILGGMATAAQVTHWHSTCDLAFERKIIAGLLDEAVERLRRRNALVELAPGERVQYKFSPAVLACELDSMVHESGVRLFLESVCSETVVEGDRILGVIIEDVGGRRAITAGAFVDASGDASLVRRAGYEARKGEVLQPVSYQALIAGIDEVEKRYPGVSIWDEVRELAASHAFPESKPWIDLLPGVPGTRNVFGARLNGIDAADPDQLTEALMEGRRCTAAFIDMIRERFPEAGEQVALVSVAQALGIRETWHAACLHRLTRDELLLGEVFEDGIANGTYPLDVHGPEGSVLKYLDGRESVTSPGGQRVWRRWRSDDEPSPMCYHIPLRCLIPQGAANLLVSGRAIDADPGAYGAVRVMVNCNQTGEAAGVAAALSVREGCDVAAVPATHVREALVEGGSILTAR
jgi:hypothetical protein